MTSCALGFNLVYALIFSMSWPSITHYEQYKYFVVFSGLLVTLTFAEMVANCCTGPQTNIGKRMSVFTHGVLCCISFAFCISVTLVTAGVFDPYEKKFCQYDALIDVCACRCVVCICWFMAFIGEIVCMSTQKQENTTQIVPQTTLQVSQVPTQHIPQTTTQYPIQYQPQAPLQQVTQPIVQYQTRAPVQYASQPTVQDQICAPVPIKNPYESITSDSSSSTDSSA